MKILIALLSILLITCSLIACQDKSSSGVKIGIVVPLEHTAMREIVAGFSDTLQKLYTQPIQIKVANAQNDPNMQRAIIQQMRDQNYALIVPIGMDTTQMTLAMIKSKLQPILSLASELSEQDRKKLKPCNLAIVHDEIPPQKLIAFIHAAYPKLTRLTLIHSASNKVFPEVNTTIAAGKQFGITVHHVMVSTLPDLYSVAHTLPATEGIFVLKDHLIVSGIATLAKIANERHIPLITSDEGSAQNGAGFALGVPEREIGAAGAKLAAEILSGKSACTLPIIDMKKLTVFINQNALKQEAQDVEKINAAAEWLGYGIHPL